MSESDYYPDKNVSKVIGIATLLVITVLLAALIGSVFLGLDFGLFDRGNEVNQAAFDFEETDNSLLIEPLSVNEGDEIAVVRGSTGETVMTIDAEDVGNIINLAEEHDITLNEGEVINLVNLVTGELVAQHEVSSNIGTENEKSNNTTSDIVISNMYTSQGATIDRGSLRNSFVNAVSEYHKINNNKGLTLPISENTYAKVTSSEISYYDASTSSSLGSKTPNVDSIKDYSLDNNLLVVSDENIFEAFEFSSVNELNQVNTNSSIIDVYVKDNEYYVLTENKIYEYTKSGLSNSSNTNKVYSNYNIIGVDNINSLFAIDTSSDKLINFNPVNGNIVWERENVLDADYDNGDLYAFFNNSDNRLEYVNSNTGITESYTTEAYKGTYLDVENGRVHYKAVSLPNAFRKVHSNNYKKLLAGDYDMDFRSFGGGYDYYLSEKVGGGDKYQQSKLNYDNKKIEVNNNGLILGNEPIKIDDLNSVDTTYRNIGGFGYIKNSFVNTTLQEKIELYKSGESSEDTYKKLDINETINIKKYYIDSNLKGDKSILSQVYLFLAIEEKISGLINGKTRFSAGRINGVEALNGNISKETAELMCSSCNLDWTLKPGEYYVGGLMGGQGLMNADQSYYHNTEGTISLDKLILYYENESGNKGSIKISTQQNIGTSGSGEYISPLRTQLISDYSGKRDLSLTGSEKFRIEVNGGEPPYNFEWSESTRSANKKPDSKTRIYNYTSSDTGEFTVEVTVTDNSGQSSTETKKFQIVDKQFEYLSTNKYSMKNSRVGVFYPGVSFTMPYTISNNDNSTKKYKFEVTTNNNVIGKTEGLISPETIKDIGAKISLPDTNGIYKLDIKASNKSINNAQLPLTYINLQKIRNGAMTINTQNKEDLEFNFSINNPTDKTDEINYKATMNGQTITKEISVGPKKSKKVKFNFDRPEKEGDYTVNITENNFKLPSKIKIEAINGTTTSINDASLEDNYGELSIETSISSNSPFKGTENINIKANLPNETEKIIYSKNIELGPYENKKISKNWNYSHEGETDIKISTSSNSKTKSINLAGELTEEIAYSKEKWESKGEGFKYVNKSKKDIIIQENNEIGIVRISTSSPYYYKYDKINIDISNGTGRITIRIVTTEDSSKFVKTFSSQGTKTININQEISSGKIQRIDIIARTEENPIGIDKIEVLASR